MSADIIKKTKNQFLLYYRRLQTTAPPCECQVITDCLYVASYMVSKKRGKTTYRPIKKQYMYNIVTRGIIINVINISVIRR